jgi:hypothetical protein
VSDSLAGEKRPWVPPLSILAAVLTARSTIEHPMAANLSSNGHTGTILGPGYAERTMISIQPVETEGAFWVHVSMDGEKMRSHGPYGDADEAGAAARQLAGICAVMGQAARVSEPTDHKQRRQRP